jgi:hypothetical protein
MGISFILAAARRDGTGWTRTRESAREYGWPRGYALAGRELELGIGGWELERHQCWLAGRGTGVRLAVTLHSVDPASLASRFTDWTASWTAVCSYSRPIMTLEPNPSRPSLYKNSAAIRSIRSSSSSSSSSLLTRASQHPPRRRGSSSKPPPSPPPPITTTYLPALPAERNIALHLQSTPIPASDRWASPPAAQ